MTSSQYRATARKIQWATTAWTAVFLIAVLYLLRTHGEWARSYGSVLQVRFGRIGGGVIFGCSILLVVAVVYLAVVVLLDRLLGVSCPHCHRSLTLRCTPERVLERGECPLCHGKVLEETGTVDN